MSDCCAPRRVLVEVGLLRVEGETCDRCGASWEAVQAAVAEAGAELAAFGVGIDLVDRPLDASRIADSNRVLVNGRPAEEWVGGSSAMTECPSCAELVGEPACCRSYEVDSQTTDALSAEVIAEAIRRAAGLASADGAPERPVAPGVVRVTLVTSPECG